MTPADREALRSLAREATPGPWEHFGRFVNPAGNEAFEEAVAKVYREEDARYLAALSPERVLGLLDALDGAERRLAAAREALVPLGPMFDDARNVHEHAAVGALRSALEGPE